jgi:hypothetical protein
MHTIYLEHLTDGTRITCRTWTQALGEFYSQWRAEDGSIPWVIVSDGHTITEEDLRT